MDPSASASRPIIERRETKNGNPSPFPLWKLVVSNPVLKQSPNGNV